MRMRSTIDAMSALGDRAVDAYRRRLQTQMEERRLAAVQLNVLVSAGMAVAGMAVDAVAMQLRVGALQRAVDEAVAAGDLHAAEALRGQLVATLEEPPASARLMTTLADYLPALMAEHREDNRIIEGRTV
jgi:streptomycin 6-kinase